MNEQPETVSNSALHDTLRIGNSAEAGQFSLEQRLDHTVDMVETLIANCYVSELLESWWVTSDEQHPCIEVLFHYEFELLSLRNKSMQIVLESPCP